MVNMPERAFHSKESILLFFFFNWSFGKRSIKFFTIRKLGHIEDFANNVHTFYC